jgi:hypothetical protein
VEPNKVVPDTKLYQALSTPRDNKQSPFETDIVEVNYVHVSDTHEYSGKTATHGRFRYLDIRLLAFISFK